MEAERLGGFERQGERRVVRRVGRGHVEDEGVDLGRLGKLDVELPVGEGEVGRVTDLLGRGWLGWARYLVEDGDLERGRTRRLAKTALAECAGEKTRDAAANTAKGNFIGPVVWWRPKTSGKVMKRLGRGRGVRAELGDQTGCRCFLHAGGSPSTYMDIICRSVSHSTNHRFVLLKKAR